MREPLGFLGNHRSRSIKAAFEMLPALVRFGIAVEDLQAPIALFAELGLELEAKMSVGGEWVHRNVALEVVGDDIAMMRTPDGHSRLELMKFQTPAATSSEPNALVSRLGVRRIRFCRARWLGPGP